MEAEKNKIDGFGLAGYRSFGPEMMYIRDLAKVNIFIGKNNSGKSNILRFCKHLSRINISKQQNTKYTAFHDLDYCSDYKEKDIKFTLQIKKESVLTGTLYGKIAHYLPDFADKVPDWRDEIWLKSTVRCLGTDLKQDLLIRELAERISNNFSFIW